MDENELERDDCRVGDGDIAGSAGRPTSGAALTPGPRWPIGTECGLMKSTVPAGLPFTLPPSETSSSPLCCCRFFQSSRAPSLTWSGKFYSLCMFSFAVCFTSLYHRSGCCHLAGSNGHAAKLPSLTVDGATDDPNPNHVDSLPAARDCHDI